MNTILQQFGINLTFFIQFAIFIVLFPLLSHFFFKPYQRLFKARHKKMIEDKEDAERLVQEANAKLEEYKKQLMLEKANAKKEFETILGEARKEEAQILGQARGDAKKITQDALDQIQKNRDVLKKQLEADVESLASAISAQLLVRKD